MRGILYRSFLVLALALFVLTLADVSSGFVLLSSMASVAVGLICLFTAIVFSKTFALGRSLVPLALLLSSCIAVACRLGGYETVVHRTDEEWETYQHQLGSRITDEVTRRFTELCHRAKSAAESLAQEPSLSKAVEELGSREILLEAFRILEATTLPRPIEEAVGGVTLYDEWQIPLAWSGKNADLSPFYDLLEVGEGGQTFTLEQGVFTYLVAVAPLVNGTGAVSVEIPLAARRSLDNRYQTDYEVVTAWAGKSVSTDFVDVREEAPELAQLFDRTEDRYWGGTRGAPVLYFPLRSLGGEVLGVCSLRAEEPSMALLEHQRFTRRLAGICLAMAALIIVGLLATNLWQSARKSNQRLAEKLVRAFLLVGAAWGLRIVLVLTDIPLGLGTDADNPAYYASGIFFDFLRSPADFLVTSILILICTLALLLPFAPSSIIHPERKHKAFVALFIRSLVSAAVLALLLLVNGLVQNTWMNSNLPLASPGLAPPNPALLAVQIGLLLLFCAAGVVGVFLFSLSERWADHPVSSMPDFLQLIALDLVVFALGYVLLAFVVPPHWMIATVVPLVVFHLIAVKRRSILSHLHSANLYPRLATAFLMTLAPVLSFYPAVVFFETQSIRQFMESTVAPAVLHHGDSKQYVLLKTLEAIDHMELSGRLSFPEQNDLAYQIWSGSDLSVSALSSSVEVYDEQQRLVSRFALNFPSRDWSAEQSREPPEEDWEIEQVPHPGEPNRPLVMNARRAFQGTDGSLWDIRIRLVADWSNLPFISARNPYIDLFRAPGSETPLPSAHGELSLYVFDLDGNLLFPSSETVLTVDQETIPTAGQEQVWLDDFAGGQEHHVLFFSDPEYVFALSYQGKAALGYVAEIFGWTLLATATGLVLLLLFSLIGIAAGHALISPQDIWAGVGTSFYGKLFVAFVLLALVPTISLAVLARGVVVQQLEREVEQEGVARARVVERFMWDYLLYQRIDAIETGAAVDDSFLEWVGGLVNSDVDLYSRGELVATSKRELFASGLLPTRAVPAVFREVVLNRANHSIHRQAVGSFQYLVVSVPITLERFGEPSIVSLPLASRQREINRQVAALNQTVLLTAICFSLVAATLAYSLARRIAEPINRLTAATRRVAQGDFDVALDAPSQDEIGALSKSFNQMTSDLKRQREDLERTKKLEAWAEMARQVAHEVKNPLTPIQLSTEHLLRVVDDDSVDFKEVLTNCTDTILQQVRTLRQISMEFSTFANPAPIELEPTDFGRLVRETVEPYRQAPPSGVTVDLTVEATIPQVSVDKRLIQRTLVNLIENAFHALNGEGRVTVVARPVEFQEKRWVEVAVSDSGAGIEPELHEKIFEPYFSTRAGGTGLGLAIARKAVEEHGGTITLESEPGQGTLVRVRLPVESAAA